jgi:helicase MOV-10
MTVVECIGQLLDNPKFRILACAPSNSASDLIAQRLIATRALGNDELFRLNAIWRPRWTNFPEELLEYSLHDGSTFRAPSVVKLNSYRVIVATCSSAALLYGFGVNPGAFTHIFIDEVGQASEPEVMIPILPLVNDSTNIILSGDVSGLFAVLPMNSH